MDLFEIPILKPDHNIGDSLIDEPSSMSNYDINSNDSYHSNISESLEYTENTGQNSKIIETEESKQAENENNVNCSNYSDMKQSETSKFITFNEYSEMPSKSMNFIEYTEFNTRKADKTHSFDDTRYEIAANSFHGKEKLVNLPKASQTSKSPIKIIESSSQTYDEEKDFRPVSHSPIQKTPKMMKTNPRSLKLDLHNINKSLRSSNERKELNITAPLVVSPEPRKSYRESYLSSYREPYREAAHSYRQSLNTALTSNRYQVDLDLLYSDQMTARKRLKFIEVELEKVYRKMENLKSQLLENEKANFIERSQKQSEINYAKIKVEVLDIKNENLEQENERLRLTLEEITGRKRLGRDLIDNRNKEYYREEYLTKNLEEPKRDEDFGKEIQNLNESKEKIERELRKLGITSQRREILRNKLQETNEKLQKIKSDSRSQVLYY